MAPLHRAPPMGRRACLRLPLAAAVAALAAWTSPASSAFAAMRPWPAARDLAATPRRANALEGQTAVAGSSEKWWEATAQGLIGKLQVEQSSDSIERLRRQMTYEEAAFDQEIEDVVVAGKRALLRLRMQKAVETPGMKTHLFKAIRKQIARALTLRRSREIARGITGEQSRRMRRRRRLELKMKYEEAYGGEAAMPKSAKWKRRMGRII